MIGQKAACIKWLVDAEDGEYEVKKHRNKRSLSANSYYWTLLTKLAGVLRTSNEELHEVMLRRYGAYEVDGDGNIVTITVRSDIDPTRWAHCERGRTSADGKWTAYRIIKGSSKYNTAEMSRLLDGLISECQECGIETMTPVQMQKLKDYVWGNYGDL